MSSLTSLWLIFLSLSILPSAATSILCLSSGCHAIVSSSGCPASLFTAVCSSENSFIQLYKVALEMTASLQTCFTDFSLCCISYTHFLRCCSWYLCTFI